MGVILSTCRGIGNGGQERVGDLGLLQCTGTPSKPVDYTSGRSYSLGQPRCPAERLCGLFLPLRRGGWEGCRYPLCISPLALLLKSVLLLKSLVCSNSLFKSTNVLLRPGLYPVQGQLG